MRHTGAKLRRAHTVVLSPAGLRVGPGDPACGRSLHAESEAGLEQRGLPFGGWKGARFPDGTFGCEWREERGRGQRSCWWQCLGPRAESSRTGWAGSRPETQQGNAGRTLHLPVCPRAWPASLTRDSSLPERGPPCSREQTHLSVFCTDPRARGLCPQVFRVAGPMVSGHFRLPAGL